MWQLLGSHFCVCEFKKVSIYRGDITSGVLSVSKAKFMNSVPHKASYLHTRKKWSQLLSLRLPRPRHFKWGRPCEQTDGRKLSVQKPSRDGGQPGSLSWTFGHEAPPGVWSQKSHRPGKPWARCSHPTWSLGEALAPPALVFPAGASSRASPPHPPSAGTLGPVPKGCVGARLGLGSRRTDAPESIVFYPDAVSRDSDAVVKHEILT